MLPCILALSGPQLTPDERAFFCEADPAGYLLFGRNCRDPEQLRALTDDLRALSGRENVPILIDQEGGRVARLGPPHWPSFPAQARFGALYALAPISGMEAARANAQAIALVLRDLGINVACLPLADLLHADTHGFIGDRAFGDDPLLVASLGRAVLDGLAAGGVVGVLKHMPGHGRAQADSHFELPVVDASKEELEADLAPFTKLAGRARIGMTAHVLYPEWDRERPATLSPTIITQVIRERIGFDGLLLSDDIVMEALDDSHAERASAALAAGCDLVLHGSGQLDEAEAVASVLPPISAEAQARLERAVPESGGDDAPLAELLAKRDALLKLID